MRLIKRLARRWLWQPIRHRYAPAPYAPLCPFSVRFKTRDGREYEAHTESYDEAAILADVLEDHGVVMTAVGDRNGAPFVTRRVH